MYEIDVIEVKKVDSQGQIKAFADVALNGELTIKGFRLMQEPTKQQYWLGFPQQVSDFQGQKKYFNQIECSDRLKKQIKDSILRKYNNHE